MLRNVIFLTALSKGLVGFKTVSKWAAFGGRLSNLDPFTHLLLTRASGQFTGIPDLAKAFSLSYHITIYSTTTAARVWMESLPMFGFSQYRPSPALVSASASFPTPLNDVQYGLPDSTQMRPTQNLCIPFRCGVRVLTTTVVEGCPVIAGKQK